MFFIFDSSFVFVQSGDEAEVLLSFLPLGYLVEDLLVILITWKPVNGIDG